MVLALLASVTAQAEQTATKPFVVLWASQDHVEHGVTVGRWVPLTTFDTAKECRTAAANPKNGSFPQIKRVSIYLCLPAHIKPPTIIDHQ
jgi:hypothetical protein